MRAAPLGQELKMSISRFFRRWRIPLATLPVIAVLVVIKCLVAHYGGEFVELSPLYTSIVAGGIFLFGLILASTLSDYKEGEKIPAEIAAACENIYREGADVKKTHNSFDLKALGKTLLEILAGFKEDINRTDSRKALTALNRLSASFLEMDALGVPPNYVVWLKTEQGAIRKALLRVYYIQRINFLPSAYFLVTSVIVLLIGLLIFTKIEPLYLSLIIVVILTYIFVYILQLLRIFEQPFQPEGTTMDDVSLFLIEELQERIEKAEEP